MASTINESTPLCIGDQSSSYSQSTQDPLEELPQPVIPIRVESLLNLAIIYIVVVTGALQN